MTTHRLKIQERYADAVLNGELPWELGGGSVKWAAGAQYRYDQYKQNPEILMKSVKNETQAENLRKAHLKDAVAHTKFMYWLKKNIGRVEITELSASARLE